MEKGSNDQNTTVFYYEDKEIWPTEVGESTIVLMKFDQPLIEYALTGHLNVLTPGSIKLLFDTIWTTRLVFTYYLPAWPTSLIEWKSSQTSFNEI